MTTEPLHTALVSPPQGTSSMMINQPQKTSRVKRVKSKPQQPKRQRKSTPSPSSTKPLLSSPVEPMSSSPLVVAEQPPPAITSTSSWEDQVHVPESTTAAPVVSPDRPVTPPQDTTSTTTTTASPSSAGEIALDFSANACVCLQTQDLKGALEWYQRALLVYQDAGDGLSIVDTCNAAATLHNMGAVYNALTQSDASLQCYHDAEQLYRECRERLVLESQNIQTRLGRDELEDQETVCLTALIAETLHHRAQIYESSVWDSVAALECHEACVELLREEVGVVLDDTPTLLVTCVDDVYFQQDCLLETKLEWLTLSYQALASLYRLSDSPRDGLAILELWKQLLQDQTDEKWRTSLALCYKQLSEFHFSQQEMALGVDALHTAMDLQSGEVLLSNDLLQQMNRIGLGQEQKGDYDQALACYEKVLLLVSRYLGEDHWEVAETLVKIGRVMELQGNPAGGLDLYHAAHTIYQAAQKDEEEEDPSVRAATESVVRIANVLMSQKRWQEAVQFLSELPQAKEWITTCLEGDCTIVPTTTTPSNQSTTTEHTSVDQAIVFRELGRAFMGMGELAKAKQCLLESARRLEGTDHEEDVFELLMHVEFCQKQERKAELACRRARSRSRSRGRSWSRHSRANSVASNSSVDGDRGGRITKDAVAAVLSPGSVVLSSGSVASVDDIKDAVAAVLSPGSVASVDDSNNKAVRGGVTGTVTAAITPRAKPPSVQGKAQSLPSSPVRNDLALATIASKPVIRDDTALPALTMPPEDGVADSNNKAPKSLTPMPLPPACSTPPRPSNTLDTLRNTQTLMSGESQTSADSRSLGSLGTQSGSVHGKKTAASEQPSVAATKLAETTSSELVESKEDPFQMTTAREAFQVQRAKDIILKRTSQDSESKSSGSQSKQDPSTATNEDDDGKSDVVSSVLLGLDIDIDLPPPPSPTAILNVPSGSTLAGLAALRSSASLEKPFDESTASQASSRERPFDERSSRNNPFNPPPNGAAPNYAVSVQQRMMFTFQDEGSKARMTEVVTQTMSVQERMMFAVQDEGSKARMTPEMVTQTMSDLTSTNGQSSTSSLNDGFAPTKAVPPLLLLNADTSEKDSYKLYRPPPPPPLPPLSPPSQIETVRTTQPARPATPPTQKHGLNDGIIQISVASQAQISSFDLLTPTYPTQSLTSEQRPEPSSPERIEALHQQQFSPIAGHNHMYHDDDDDASSDPFEGYEDFDEDDEESAGTPSYGGDSESEEGYTRFSREDLSSEEENSVGSYRVERNDDERKKQLLLQSFQQGVAACDDTRQPHQAHDAQPDSFSAGTRESPVPATNPANVQTTYAPEQSDRNAASKRESSPTFEVQEQQATAKESDALATTPPAAKRSSLSSRKSEISKGSPGTRIVKALSNSMRRRRKSKKSGHFEVVGSGAEGEAGGEAKQEESAPIAPPELNLPADTIEQQESDTFVGGPIQFVSMASPSYDENVSQITFALDENYAKYNKSNQWWGQLSLPTQQLEGYIHQAVEAAEGFLSAKAIHAKMKSQPLDFDSEDEEDDDMIVRDPSTLPLGTTASKADVVACSPIPNSLLFKAINQPHPMKPSIDEIKDSPVIVEKDAILPMAPTASSLVPADLKGVPSAKSNLEVEIETLEKSLQQYELEALNDDKATVKVASTLFQMSILFLQNEKVDEALKATNEALRHQKFLGDSPNATRSLHLLADIFVRKGEYESALSCYTEVQELELELYGYIHEETANTLNRIGSVLARQSKFSMAMDKHQEALRILKECHGEELRHPLVSQTLIHIGAVYYRERNSLETVRTGVDEYSTFIEVGMLEVIGRAHEDRGSYKMAISFFEEKLQCLHQKRKDPKSAEGRANLEDVATTLNSLGMLSCRAGIFMEAIDYYDKALEVQKQIGCDKLHIATARVLTATVQFHLGFFQKALRMLQDALKELQAETGSEHETVAATWYQIGVVQVALCEYDAGMDALEEALRIQTNLLGKVHPATLRTCREIGNMYAIYESEVEAAFTQFNDILTLQRRIHGHKHPNVAETLHSLGCAYARKEDFANAIKTLEECYYMRIDYLGADHPLQATTLHEIAEIHRKRQRYRKAIHICNAVLEIRKESLSERHIDVARALATKASCLVATCDYGNAMKCLQEALPMAEQAVGARHPAVADIFVHLGGIHLRKCHFDEAKEWIGKALDIYQNSNLDEDHPSMKAALSLMERVDRDEMLCV